MSDDQQQPPDADVEAAKAAMDMIGGLLVAYAPHLDMKTAHGIAAGVLNQQEALGQVLADGAEPTKRQSHPTWGFKLHVASRPGAFGVVECPKDVGQAKSLDDILHHATVIAMVTSPTARAVLAAHGYHLEFFQGTGKPAAPEIVKPS